ncbi:MAG: aldehyde dehydrogenase family protein, partial [Gammaproteobacteria bacterium]|nr:aldehyde dehydrogenase family protein [Gammaproteobacteria bacterium]
MDQPGELSHFIAGQHVPGSSNRFGDVFNPATGAVSARVPLATAQEVDRAVRAAREAFPAWAATPPAQRARIMFRYRELLEREKDALARIVTSEHGKTLDDAKGSVLRGLEVVEFVCGIP